MSSRTGQPGSVRIVVLGYIVRGPLGGLVWHHLQYVLGLARLGHDVYFLEDSGDSPWCCYDAERHVTDADPRYGLKFASDVFASYGLQDRWAYYDAHRARWHGPVAARAIDICRSAELLLNVSGVNAIRPWLEPVPRRALIDTDPAFTQLRHLTEAETRGVAAWHTDFFSFGENIEAGLARIPSDGFPWRSTRQPIVLDVWPMTRGPEGGLFTTVMQWDSYPLREYAGQRYGMKSDSFAPYLHLPSLVGPRFELAVGGPAHDILLKNGWNVSNPLEVARYPDRYQQYIRRSKAEFSVAKHGYVVSNSGWFSERSAAYLASGRPVVTQNTGFVSWLPTGEGVHAFDTVDDVCAAMRKVDAAYRRECDAARAIAEEFFDSGKVLSRLLEQALNAVPPTLRV